MLSQSTTVRTWVFMGMAMFYVLFLLTVMKFFENSEPPVMASVPTKPVESIVATDHDALPDLTLVAERQMSSHVVRVSSHSLYPPQDLDYRTLLRREFDKDDSKMSAVIVDGIRASSFCDDNSNRSDIDMRDRCRRLFPTNVRPRLRQPMLRRNGLVIRSLLRWVRTAIGPKNLAKHRGVSRTWGRRQLLSEKSERFIVNSELGTSKIR